MKLPQNIAYKGLIGKQDYSLYKSGTGGAM
jgi:hypothetical protein